MTLRKESATVSGMGRFRPSQVHFVVRGLLIPHCSLKESPFGRGSAYTWTYLERLVVCEFPTLGFFCLIKASFFFFG